MLVAPQFEGSANNGLFSPGTVRKRLLPLNGLGGVAAFEVGLNSQSEAGHWRG